MKEVKLTVKCSCGFWVQRMFYTNEHGYFEIPQSYCPDCFNMLVWSILQLPMDKVEVEEYHNVGVKDAHKY